MQVNQKCTGKETPGASRKRFFDCGEIIMYIGEKR